LLINVAQSRKKPVTHQHNEILAVYQVVDGDTNAGGFGPLVFGYGFWGKEQQYVA